MTFAQAGVSSADITLRSAPHEQVASFLMAADVALLLRENTLTNRVASPVKFAEYLRCGVPVIMTHYVGDLAEVAVREGVGETVNFPVAPNDIAGAARRLRARLDDDKDDFRRRCSEVAESHLSWGHQLRQLVGLYATLAGSAACDPPRPVPCAS